MQKIYFSIHINASRAKVWDTMLSDVTYRIWTNAFSKGSYFQGNWEEGSKMLFLGPGEQGVGDGGMVSRIRENRLHDFISIEHQGIVKNGVEDTTSDEARKWAPAYENYTFVEKDNGTELTIEMDIEDEYKPQFEKMWPEALQSLKELAEK